MNSWEAIFLQSPANYGIYDEEDLPHLLWEWPKQTWLQDRLVYLRERRLGTLLKNSSRSRETHELPTM
jgi:hypothetical protein